MRAIYELFTGNHIDLSAVVCVGQAEKMGRHWEFDIYFTNNTTIREWWYDEGFQTLYDTFIRLEPIQVRSNRTWVDL